MSDCNRFAKESRGSLFDTFVGFAITNILFYFGGWILGLSNVICTAAAIKSIFFGLILLMFILHKTSNAFADVYSEADSTRSIFHKIKQRYLIIGGFTVLSSVLAIIVPISQYERISSSDRSDICSFIWNRYIRLLYCQRSPL
jgi:purine-cytosine permease-like protein